MHCLPFPMVSQTSSMMLLTYHQGAAGGQELCCCLLGEGPGGQTDSRRSAASSVPAGCQELRLHLQTAAWSEARSPRRQQCRLQPLAIQVCSCTEAGPVGGCECCAGMMWCSSQPLLLGQSGSTHLPNASWTSIAPFAGKGPCCSPCMRWALGGLKLLVRLSLLVLIASSLQQCTGHRGLLI